jgi:S-adenosylmethionine hydrolase
MPSPFISFLSDFGSDTAPAVCRGVIWTIAPETRILDLTHSVRQFAVRDGAFLLWSAAPYLPVGVHLAVVDPGVGTARRPIAVRAQRGDLFVGPDNGLLIPAAERIGGIIEARELTNRALMRDQVSRTFHGRDLFAPMAAHLAGGVPLDRVGPSIDPRGLLRIELPAPAIVDGRFETSVLFIDTFGNCRLAGGSEDLAALTGGEYAAGGYRVHIGSSMVKAPWVETFGGVAAGAPLLYEDADYAGLALGVNQGSAAERFGLMSGAAISIEPVD